MRCNKVKRLLTEGSNPDHPDLSAHLKECAECRKTADALRELDSLLESAQSEVPVPDLGTARRSVESRSGTQSGWETIVTKVKDKSNEHRGLISGVSFALAVFLLVMLIPFSYTTVTGYQITLAGGVQSEISTDLLTAALAAVGYEDLVVTDGAVAGQYVLSGLQNEPEARDIAVALAALCGSEQAPLVEAVTGKASGTIYAQAAKKITEDEEGPIRIKLEDGRFIINDSNLTSVLYSSETSGSELESEIRKFLSVTCDLENDIVVSAEIDDDNDFRIIKLRTADKADSTSPDFSVYMSRDVLAFGGEEGDSANALPQLIDLFANGDLDSLTDKLDRGIILELPGGKEVGGEAVMIRVHLAPREDKDKPE